MKPNILVNASFCVALFSCATLLSEGILHENKKQTLRGLFRVNTVEPKPGSIKGNEVEVLSRTSRKSSSAESVLR